MSKQIKRVLCVLCCLAILLLAAACDTTGNNNNNTGNNNAGNTGNNNTGNSNTGNNNAGGNAGGENEGPDPLGKYDPPITITTVRSVDANTKFEPGNPDRDSLEKNIWARAYEEQLGIVFDYLWVVDGSEYNNKWQLSIASNEIPDTAQIGGGIYAALLEAGYIEDMTDIYEAYAGDEYKYCNELDKGLAIKSVMQDGRMMGLPCPGATAENTPMMFIREDWLNQLGRPVPKTSEEVIDLARAFMAAQLGGPDTYGIASNKAFRTGMFDILGFINGYGAYYDMWIPDKNGDAAYSNILPEFRSALLVLQSLYAEGILSQEAVVNDMSMAVQGVAQNKCGIVFGAFATPLMLAANTASNPDAEWLVLPIVATEGATPRPQSYTSKVDFQLFVKKGMKYPEAIVKLINIKFILSEDKAYSIVDGYEQHKYAFSEVSRPGALIDGHNAVKQAIDSGDTSELDIGEMNMYEQVMDSLDGNRENNFRWIMGSEPNTTCYRMKQNRETQTYVVNMWQGIPSEYMSQNAVVLNTVLEEAIQRVILGEDISLFDQAVETWKASGGDQVTREVNEWYQANK